MTTGGAESHWEELARSAADGREEVAAEELRHFLTFRVADSPYAVPVEAVREIVRMRPVTPMPRVAAEIRGVISLRGEIIQVVDLRRRLGLAPIEPTRQSRIVVLQVDDELTAGLLVDRVNDVLRAVESDLSPPIGSETGAVEALIKRGDEFVSLLDLGRALGGGDG